MTLDTNAAEVTSNVNVWNPAPSPTLISSGSDGGAGGTDGIKYICYAWKAVTGVSAFGTYDGNALNVGPIVDLGFIPRLVIIKAKNGVGSWLMFDAFRSGANSNGESMLPYFACDLAELESSTNNQINIYDVGAVQGFRPATAGDAASNSSAVTYIYAAFA